MAPAKGPNSTVPNDTNVSETDIRAATFGSLTGSTPLTRVSTARNSRSTGGGVLTKLAMARLTTVSPQRTTATT